ncbi:hypothetical protein CJF30_00005728 [Rutstroemia sp. NJR-2017a BBW]|nr:hypothetical protein CJF30_00005728 [Rutstroemia sp. NJR-2017a BBW]
MRRLEVGNGNRATSVLLFASLFSLSLADILSVSKPDEPTPTSTAKPLSGANNINSAVVVPIIVASVSVFVAFLLILCLKVPVPERFLFPTRDDGSTLRSGNSRLRFSWLHRPRKKPTVWPHSVYNGGEFESRACGDKLEMRVVDEIPGFPGQWRSIPLSRQETEKMSQARMEEEAEARIRAMLERMNPEDRAWASEQLIYGQTDELRAANIGQAY